MLINLLLPYSGTGVRLFKRVKRGAAFAPSAINRRGAAAQDPLPATRLSERDMDSDAEETVPPGHAAAALCSACTWHLWICLSMRHPLSPPFIHTLLK